jgi:predicted outer membrane repeat protein
VFAGSSLALSGTQVISNSSGNHGAGAFATGPATLSGGLFQINACTQANCSGGGLYAQAALTVTATTFDGNSALSDGGGAYAGGDAALAQGVFQNNTCTQAGCRGGGLHAVQGLVLTGTQFLTNTARDGGGGVFGNVGAADRVQGGLFLNNSCGAALCLGGGLEALSPLALTGTQFLNNTAISSGGGLYAAASATLDQAAFFHNSAFLGGGLYHAGASGHVINSVFGNNLANNSGAAIFINTSGLIILKQDTIGMPDFDVPTSSVALLSGNLAVTNTIFILYDVGIDSGPGHVYEDYNLFDHVGHPANGNVLSGGHSFSGVSRPANPDFNDYHLLPGSAAIDRGVNDGVPIDFDGQPRPHGPGFDIGFDETYFLELYLPLVRRP